MRRISRFLLIAIIVLFSSAIHGFTPAQAACPDTTGSVTVTNPDDGDCAGADWDGGDGDDTLINAGSAGNVTGGPGNDNESNTIDNTDTGTISGNAYGNFNDIGDVTNTVANITNDGLVQGYIFGNRANDDTHVLGSVNGGTAIITLNEGDSPTTGVVDNDVVGNQAETGEINPTTTASITNSGLVKGVIYGNEAAGMINTANATIILKAGNGSTTGTVSHDVVGNYSTSGNIVASDANMTNSGYVGGSLYGNLGATGLNDVSAEITLELGDGSSSGVVNGNAYGNFAANNDLTAGRATFINSGTVNGYAYGNYAANSIDDAHADVTNSGIVSNNLYGNYTYGSDMTAAYATVTSNGLVSGYLFGNSSGGDMLDVHSTVVVGAGGEVDNFVYGNNAATTINISSADITIDGLVKGDVTGNNANSGLTTPTNSTTNITVGSTGEVDGSINAPGDANSTATVDTSGPVKGAITTGSGADTITIRYTVGSSLPANSDAVLAGAGNDTITVTGSVNGNVKSGQGSDNVTIGAGSNVSGIISGNDSLTPNDFTVPAGTNPGDFDVLTFFDTTSSESDLQALKNIAANGGSGTVTFGGHTYTWVNFNQLQVLLQYIVIVTWFNPGDGRVDPRPGDRLAFYCNIDKGTVGAYLVNGDSTGTALTTFTIGDLRAAGAKGIYHDLGSLGTISLSVDGQNDFWGAWNGGIWHATGQGDFAKGFTCNFK